MPHFTVEYSANLEPSVDIGAVVEVVRSVAVETGIFPLGGIRVRAIRCEHFAIADGGDNYGFLDMVLRLGEGRDLATRKKAGEQIFRRSPPILIRSSREQVRVVVRHADQRQGDELEAQQHPRRVEGGDCPWIRRHQGIGIRPIAIAPLPCSQN
jgi:5-carboxymethyl-2-hydroxymuconate isomerase